MVEKLPSNFEGWAIQNEDGYGGTVAHLWVVMGNAPRFPLDLANRMGETVAHLLARRAIAMPEDFDGWGWKDKNGKSVIDTARERGHGHLIAQYEAWRLRQSVEETTPGVARIARTRL